MQSYQLHIDVSKNITIEIGKFGRFDFPSGKYIYTGSAKKNIDSRINRHLSQDHNKKLHWHIDYLLNSKNVKITRVEKFNETECSLNQKTQGKILIKNFGSTDCKAKCQSHLKYVI